MRVIAGGMTRRGRRPRGMIGLDVAHDIMRPMHPALPVSKAVACLREEDGNPHHEREEEGRETGRLWLSH